MILTVDIGNTNINSAVFKNNKIVKRFAISTEAYQSKILKNKLKKIRLDTAIICSVVPRLTPIFKKDLKLFSKVYIVGNDIKVPIRNLYRNPKQLGQDRLVNAYAGSILYNPPCIIVDLGTAITFDIVSKNNAYLGGLILPGLNMTLRALARGTALLPKVKLKKPKEFIGKDTENSIISGLVYGFGVLIDGLIKKIKKKLGYNCIVVGTGGDSLFIYRYCHLIDIIDRDLTLKGLYLLSRTIRR